MKWSISKISKECKPCQKIFHDGEQVFSTVVMNENTEDNTIETERFDICSLCWEKWQEKENPFWKCSFREKEDDESAKLPDKDIVMNLFLQKAKTDTQHLEEKEKKEVEVLSYLLALMLERKRRLILCEAKDDKWNNQVFYRDAKGEELFQLNIPEIEEEDIALFQEMLKDLLPIHGTKTKTKEEPSVIPGKVDQG